MPAWSPDGKRLAFIGSSPASQVAEAPTSTRKWRLEEAARYRKGSIVYSLTYSPDGRRVVMGGDPVNQGVHQLDLASGEVTNLGGRGIRVVMFPDGRRFATSWLSPLIQIIDIDSHEVLRELSHGAANVRTFAMSPDGLRLVSGGLDNLMHVWDTSSGELLLSFNEHRDWITQVAFTPDGAEVISADHGKTIRVWNVHSGKQRLELKHPAVAWGLAVSPDGRHFLTGSGGQVATTPQALKIVPGDDNSLRLWDAADGTLVREMKGHTEAAYSVDISPDGRLAASAGWDGNICLWDLQTGERLDLVNDRKGRAAEVVFSPDGRHVMVGGGGRRVDREIVEFPDEQLRLYRLVEQPPQGSAQ
jgi:WD40 repeat protein